MYYFAYASNLNRRQMAERCPDSLPALRATLPNYRLIFSGWSRQWRSPTASIKPFQGDRVVGAAYEITELCLQRLDRYEGYPGTYDHLEVRVIDEEGQPFRAVTYIMRKQAEEARPSRDYLAVIQQGYRDWEIT